MDFFHKTPDEAGSSSSKCGGHEGVGSKAISGKSRTSVETIPADPEHTGANHDKHHAVWGHFFLPKTLAFPEHDTQNESGPTGRHVNHSATSEVDGRKAGSAVPDAIHETVEAPNHVGEREVNDEHPNRHEKHHGRELHAFSDGTDDQRRGDDRKHELIHGEHGLTWPASIVGVRSRADAFQEEILEATEVRCPRRCTFSRMLTEDERVTHEIPEDGDETCDAEALSKHAKHVLRADKTTIEKSQTWQCHEQHQSSTNHEETVVTRTREIG